LLAEQIQRFAGLFGEADNFGLAGTLSTPAYQVFDISPKCVHASLIGKRPKWPISA
jgi:hypothetical protein